jgi:predicted nucleic acid-binding protein
MIYVDTSVLVPMFTKEPESKRVMHWYASSADKLVSAVWCVTEFASALGIKQRTGQIDPASAQVAWKQFERFCANDLQLMPVEYAAFNRAAAMTLDASTGLRAGDSLHLAAALEINANSMATLDGVLAKNAKKMSLILVL